MQYNFSKVSLSQPNQFEWYFESNATAFVHITAFLLSFPDRLNRNLINTVTCRQFLFITIFLHIGHLFYLCAPFSVSCWLVGLLNVICRSLHSQKSEGIKNGPSRTKYPWTVFYPLIFLWAHFIPNMFIVCLLFIMRFTHF